MSSSAALSKTKTRSCKFGQTKKTCGNGYAIIDLLDLPWRNTHKKKSFILDQKPHFFLPQMKKSRSSPLMWRRCHWNLQTLTHCRQKGVQEQIVIRFKWLRFCEIPRQGAQMKMIKVKKTKSFISRLFWSRKQSGKERKSKEVNKGTLTNTKSSNVGKKKDVEGCHFNLINPLPNSNPLDWI